MTRMRIAASLLLATSLLATAGCESAQNNPKQTGGAILGGIAGGVLGSQIGGGTGRTVAIIGGTVLGGLLGSEIGKSLDNADKAYMKTAEQKAYTAPVGQSIAWNNPDSGHSGAVMPTREGRDTNTGAACREFKTTINVDGRTENATGQACQQADGSWKVVN